ncbi:NAD(P)H-binding protein [Glycomyces sp. A-F 0318]|uniref:NAD(P)H-binding protein n=1 Tax=Glycomyces amatae TaxID=2881355 RepID=UPI001E53F6FD|nr:NAD(P)H-binding protein [Glycomyces amatae]MCD0444058.1 NAD(P)H-binding protein [Glycomyces amatae]
MIVVTGATGNTGRPLVEALLAAGEDVAAVSRGGADFPAGVLHRKADLGVPDSLEAAFEGADRLFLLVRDQALDIAPVVEAAADAGVGRVVLLSSETAATRNDESQLRFEAAVTGSGLEWTILRPGGFASNALLWSESIRRGRSATAPFGDVGMPIVDPLDIAAVAAAALTEDGHAGREYSLTGPELVTPRGQVAAIGAAIGEPVAFVEQSRKEAYEQLLRFWPADVVEASLEVMGRPNEAERRISPDVERVLGRRPHAFAEWARRNAAAFR